MATPEEKARQLIDAQLVAAGWVIQDRDEMNLGAGGRERPWAKMASRMGNPKSI